MICKNCKKEIPDNSLFCEFCNVNKKRSSFTNNYLSVLKEDFFPVLFIRIYLGF